MRTDGMERFHLYRFVSGENPEDYMYCRQKPAFTCGTACITPVQQMDAISKLAPLYYGGLASIARMKVDFSGPCALPRQLLTV